MKKNSLVKNALCLTLVTVLVSTCHTDICDAKKQTSTNQQETLHAYKKFLKKNVSSFQPEDFEKENTENYKKCSQFMITDMNQDGTPELITWHDIAYKQANLYVYTYENGKMKLLRQKTEEGMLDHINVSYNAAGSYEVYKDEKGYLHTDWNYGADEAYHNSTYTIKNGNLWCYLEEEKDSLVSPAKHIYKMNGKETTEKKYREKYEKLTKASDGEMVQNNSKNRNTLLN